VDAAVTRASRRAGDLNPAPRERASALKAAARLVILSICVLRLAALVWAAFRYL
jgi:hypothetical protein